MRTGIFCQARTRAWAAAVLLAAAIMTSGCSTGEIMEVSFPEDIGLQAFPVTVEFPEGYEDTTSLWTAAPPDCQRARREIAQVWVDSTGPRPVRKLTFMWQLVTGKGGESRYFTLQRPDADLVPESGFSFSERGGKFLDLTEKGRPVLSYVFGMHLADGVPEDRRRSSYVHPVHGLDGEVLTDDFPEDHHHHRGIFWTWPQVIYRDSTYSLWDIRGIHQKFEGWLERRAGFVFADLGVQNGWYLDDGSRIVDERVHMRVYRETDLGRLIDFELRWEAADEPVALLGSPDIKGYGGFSMRFAPFDNPVIITSGGKQEEDSNRLPFKWADFSAEFRTGTQRSGAAIFDHPDNIDFPNGWCLRHYGFEGIAWPGVEPFVLQPGSPVIARYRVLIHRQDAVDADIEAAWRAWETPAGATLLAGKQ